MRVLTFNEFLERARRTHGDLYNYSKARYINFQTKVCIICSKHGEFWQTPNDHFRGRGCPKCGLECCGKGKRLGREDFIKKARAKHGDWYDYSLVVYKNQDAFLTIICPEHGEFQTTGSKHLRGTGCPKCRN